MTKEKSLVLIALFTALTAALGLIPALMMPWGVPVSAQSLGVMLAGVILGAKRGAISMTLFVILVALGLPLLSGGRGGLGALQGPTAGFIIGFPFAAFVTGLVVEKMKGNIAVAAGIGAVFGGIITLYTFGIAGFSFVTGNTLIASVTTMAIYIPGDIAKAALTVIVTQAVWAARPQSVLSRST